jgi:hypothetical protein
MTSVFTEQMMRGALPVVCLLGAMSWSCAQEPPAQQTPAEQPPAQSAPALPAVLGDGAGAQYKRVENMHQTRFIEIFLAAREAGTGNMVAACFNTMFTSKGIPASKDTAPQALVEGLDFEKMKQEYGVLGASLNGPKLWLSDWTDIDVGRNGSSTAFGRVGSPAEHRQQHQRR